MGDQTFCGVYHNTIVNFYEITTVADRRPCLKQLLTREFMYTAILGNSYNILEEFCFIFTFYEWTFQRREDLVFWNILMTTTIYIIWIILKVWVYPSHYRSHFCLTNTTYKKISDYYAVSVLTTHMRWEHHFMCFLLNITNTHFLSTMSKRVQAFWFILFAKTNQLNCTCASFFL